MKKYLLILLTAFIISLNGYSAESAPTVQGNETRTPAAQTQPAPSPAAAAPAAGQSTTPATVNPAQTQNSEDSVVGASDYIVAQIEEEIILMSDLRDTYNLYKVELTRQNKPAPAFDLATKNMLLKRLIEDTILVIYAKREQIEVSEAQLNKRLNDIKTQFRLETDEEVVVAANRSGMLGRIENINHLRDKIRHSMLLMNAKQSLISNKFRDKLLQPSEEQMKVFYNNNARYFYGPESVKLQHLVMRVDENADFEVLEKIEKLLKQIVTEAKAGADFTALVMKHADPTYRSNNGFVSNQYLKRDELNSLFPKYVKHAFTLKNGEISPIIVDGNKRIVLKVIERKDKELRPFDEVKEMIKQYMLSEQGHKLIEEWLKKQTRARFIKIYHDRLRIGQ